MYVQGDCWELACRPGTAGCGRNGRNGTIRKTMRCIDGNVCGEVMLQRPGRIHSYVLYGAAKEGGNPSGGREWQVGTTVGVVMDVGLKWVRPPPYSIRAEVVEE